LLELFKQSDISSQIHALLGIFWLYFLEWLIVFSRMYS
jgi:hypothetical protein